VSVYAIAYYTRDSEIYLLPVSWLMALWLALGMHEIASYSSRRWSSKPVAPVLVGLGLTSLLALTVVRLPTLSLRSDRAAESFISGAAAELEPGAILISLADGETFALWYGAWASGELLDAAPGLVLINYSLYQFDWYRRLLREQYPDVVGDQRSVEELLATQAGRRSIFFSEPLSFASEEQLIPTGSLWRYQP
jgi:hypothetical protein